MAKRDNNTIAVTLRFWTNNLAKPNPEFNSVCWDCGVMTVESNVTKGIVPLNPKPFNCPEDIFPLLKELFRTHKIAMVSASRKPRVLSHRRRAK